jgi:glycosyltransferase involved in cell wall biosynthesis
MKIGFVSAMNCSPWGGSEELWSQAALRLAREGHQISASVCKWPARPAPIDTLIRQGARIHFRPSEEAPLVSQGIYKVLQIYTYWIKWERPDLLVISQGDSSSGLEWMEVCRKSEIPFIAIAHANSEMLWPNDQRAAALARAYSAARHLFCVSRHNLQLLEWQLGVSLAHASVIQNPLNLSSRDCQPWPQDDAIWKIACLARLQPRDKGQDVLLRVLAHERWRSRPIRVDFIGEGSWSSSLKQLAVTLELTNVRFCGHLSDVQAVWKQRHIMALPSRSEGTPIALQEAMVCGRPAIVTDVGGNAEWCQDGITGFVAAAPTVDLFDDAMERAWQQREKWRTMGLAAHDYMKTFSQPDPVGEFCRKLLELGA